MVTIGGRECNFVSLLFHLAMQRKLHSLYLSDLQTIFPLKYLPGCDFSTVLPRKYRWALGIGVGMLSAVPMKSIACLWGLHSGSLEAVETWVCRYSYMLRLVPLQVTRLTIHLVRSAMASESWGCACWEERARTDSFGPIPAFCFCWFFSQYLLLNFCHLRNWVCPLKRNRFQIIFWRKIQNDNSLWLDAENIDRKSVV